MNTGSVTVREAIARGVKVVERPSKIILISAVVLCVLLLIVDFSWGYFLLLPLGVFISFLYTAYATPRWRIWAYGQVNDIYQFQRSAELAGMLARQSSGKAVGFMSTSQRAALAGLQTKFEQEPVFVDDLSIPQETIIYGSTFFGASNKPALVLSESGLQMGQEGVYKWDQVEDEHIGRVSFSRTDQNFGGENRAGSNDFFRCTCPAGRLDIPLSSLDITAWELDLFLYIYRGRFEMKQKQAYAA